MPNKTSPFDPFDYMDIQYEINDFLCECLEDYNPNFLFQHGPFS